MQEPKDSGVWNSFFLQQAEIRIPKRLQKPEEEKLRKEFSLRSPPQLLQYRKG